MYMLQSLLLYDVDKCTVLKYDENYDTQESVQNCIVQFCSLLNNIVLTVLYFTILH